MEVENYINSTSIEYQIGLKGSDKQIANGFFNNQIDLPGGFNSFEDRKADKKDCLIALSCGFLTGMMDALLAKEFSLRDAQAIGKEQINQFVIQVAASQGCTKNNIESSIRYLEKKYINPSDRLTAEFGGGLQHHLRDFSHHASIVGCFFSILSQFSGTGYGTDTEGKVITPDLPEDTVYGQTIEEKISNGILNWVLHLISDMAGSSNNPGSGTGIPGPILSLLKEASSLSIFREKKIPYKGQSIALHVWIAKLFNGTAFDQSDNNDPIRFDFRTEVGLYDYGLNQYLFVVLNRCLVKAFYFIRRLSQVMKNQSSSALLNLNPRSVLPNNNRCITRMITIASGTFTAIDIIGAALAKKIKPHTIDTFTDTSSIWIHINYVGIANFAISIKHDIRYITDDLRTAIENKKKSNILPYIDAQELEMAVDMDNTSIYRYRFDELLKRMSRNRNWSRRVPSEKDDRKMIKNIFDIRSDEYDQYVYLVDTNESLIRYGLEKTILTVFDQNNIEYEQPLLPEKRLGISFIMNSDGKRIGFVFLLKRLMRGLKAMYRDYKDKSTVDQVRIFFSIDALGNKDGEIELLNNLSQREFQSYFNFASLVDFFECYVRKGEYQLFKQYADDFNDKAKTIIAYKTVSIPTEDELNYYKKKKAEMIKNYEFEDNLPSDLYQYQKVILKSNFLEKGRYKALFTNEDFADSFITSEWNYDVSRGTGIIDQTGVVAGYLKSIEQLLYRVVLLSIDKNKDIKLKNGMTGKLSSDNREHIDSTLGSLVHFVKDNSDLWAVNKFTQRYIVDQLFDWIHNERNGHLHKDNIHDAETVDRIRNQALMLYYLILGAFLIPDNCLSEFGLVDEEPLDTVDEELLYRKFISWINPIILYDIAGNADSVSFVIDSFAEKPWELRIESVKEAPSGDHRERQVYSSYFMANTFVLMNHNTWEEGVEQVTRLVERFISEKTSSSMKLKKIPKVMINDLFGNQLKSYCF